MNYDGLNVCMFVYDSPHHPEYICPLNTRVSHGHVNKQSKDVIVSLGFSNVLPALFACNSYNNATSLLFLILHKRLGAFPRSVICSDVQLYQGFPDWLLSMRKLNTYQEPLLVMHDPCQHFGSTQISMVRSPCPIIYY